MFITDKVQVQDIRASDIESAGGNVPLVESDEREFSRDRFASVEDIALNQVDKDGTWKSKESLEKIISQPSTFQRTIDDECHDEVGLEIEIKVTVRASRDHYLDALDVMPGQNSSLALALQQSADLQLFMETKKTCEAGEVENRMSYSTLSIEIDGVDIPFSSLVGQKTTVCTKLDHEEKILRSMERARAREFRKELDGLFDTSMWRNI